MNAAQIAEAVAALDEAGRALRCGDLNVNERTALGNRCYNAACRLGADLAKIPVPIADEPA